MSKLRSAGESQGKLFILSAPSGAGKTTLTHGLIERLKVAGREAQFSVSYTTRAPRPGEQEGVDYHFVSTEQFASMADSGEFLEHAQVFDRVYGTGNGATEALLAQGIDVILDIDWQGARQVRKAKPDVVTIFIEPPSLKELERRLISRGQDDDVTIARRMRDAESELSHKGEYDHVVINDDYEKALNELEALFLKD